MKGLLMKDLLNLRQTIRVWALLLVLFIVIGFAQRSPIYITSMLTVMVLLLRSTHWPMMKTANGMPTP